jgi:hypothetical protein
MCYPRHGRILLIDPDNECYSHRISSRMDCLPLFRKPEKRQALGGVTAGAWGGLKLGAYEILSPLGGGMGEVYRATDTDKAILCRV